MITRAKFLPYLVLFLLLAAVTVFWFLWDSNKQSETAKMKLPVVIVNAARGNIDRKLELTGLIQSDNQVTILPRISGRLDAVLVEVGDTVSEGQTVAQIDPELYRLQLTQIEAAFRASESTFNRVENLYNSGSSSQENYNQAKGQYESLKSQYELAQLQYEYTNLQSPVSGTVLMKHINKGAIVAPQVAVLTIGSLSELSIEVKIPEEYYPYFSENYEDRDITISHPSIADISVAGKITSVSPYISPGSRNFTVTLSMEPSRYLRPGMLIYIEFVLESRRQVLYVPQSVLVGEDLIWYVDEEGTARLLEYTPEFQTDRYIQIPEDWAELNIILQGQHFLTEGQPVYIQGEEIP